jgi:hypothetical protein
MLKPILSYANLSENFCINNLLYYLYFNKIFTLTDSFTINRLFRLLTYHLFISTTWYSLVFAFHYIGRVYLLHILGLDLLSLSLSLLLLFLG